MIERSLAVFGLERKSYVASPKLGHLTPMRETLQNLVVRRLAEEMQERRLSANSLARICKVGQTSISRILAGKQDPSLEKIEELAAGLGVPPWYLLVEREATASKVISPPSPKPREVVVSLRAPYPRVFAAQQPKQKYRTKGKKTA